MNWADLSVEERNSLLSRKTAGENVASLAAELSINPATLDRRLRELRQWKDTEPVRATYRNPEYAPVSLKSAVFDIETTEFYTGGPHAHMICGCILPLDGEVETYSITFKDNRDDRHVLRNFIDALSNYDILIGHNVLAFDMNWLYSRLVYFGMPRPQSWVVYDTYQAARRLTIKDYKGLGSLGAFFGVDGEKTAIFRPEWHMIDSQYRDDFDRVIEEIEYHCQQDVLLNRQVFSALWGYDPVRKFSATKW